jgi:hypothetical protein
MGKNRRCRETRRRCRQERRSGSHEGGREVPSEEYRTNRLMVADAASGSRNAATAAAVGIAAAAEAKYVLTSEGAWKPRDRGGRPDRNFRNTQAYDELRRKQGQREWEPEKGSLDGPEVPWLVL